MLKPHALLLNDEPGESGSAPAPAPAPVEAPAPAPAPTDAPAPAPAPAEPENPFAGLDKALEVVSEKPAEPTPTPAPSPAPTAAPVAGKPPAPTPTPAPEMDFTPPEGITERAKERWGQLTERAKQATVYEQQAREVSTQLQSVRELVNNSGLDATEFTDMLEMARLFKSGDAKALQQLDGLRADLATRLGVEVAGVDPLAAHPDLKADVEGMTLTKERALEIARGRDAAKRLEGMGAEQRGLEQHKQLIATASQRMDAALSKRVGTVGHQEKLNYIGAQFKNPATLQRFVATYRPDQWEDALLMMYDAYTPPAPPPVPLPGPQPLRPTAHAAGNPVRTGPATAESAVEGAFARLGL